MKCVMLFKCLLSPEYVTDTELEKGVIKFAKLILALKKFKAV